jgi:hypothetical protein
MAENNANKLIRAFNVVSFINNYAQKEMKNPGILPAYSRISKIILIYFS